MAIFAALKVNRPGQPFMAIKRSAGDAGNFLVVNDRLAILYDGDVVHTLAVDTATHRVYAPEQQEDGHPVARMMVYEAIEAGHN